MHQERGSYRGNENQDVSCELRPRERSKANDNPQGHENDDGPCANDAEMGNHGKLPVAKELDEREGNAGAKKEMKQHEPNHGSEGVNPRRESYAPHPPHHGCSLFNFPVCVFPAHPHITSYSCFSHANNDRNNDSFSCLALPVDFPTVADLHHQNKKNLVMDFVENAVVSYTETVTIFSCELLCS